MGVMKLMALLPLLMMMGCEADESAGGGSSAGTAAPQMNSSQRGGTITVGEDHWTVVPSIQCSVFPNNVVNIAGHAASDPQLQMVVEYGGPTQIRIGSDNDARDKGAWYAVPETIEITVEGKRVRGTATFVFTGHPGGSAESRQGSFDVQC